MKKMTVVIVGLCTRKVILRHWFRVQDRGLAIPDTACRFSVTGDKWWNDYFEDLKACGLDHLVKITPEKERYRFGNDGIKESFQHVRCPGIIATK